MNQRKKRKLKLTKSFYSSFFLLFAVVFVLFLAFTCYSYYSSRSAMHHEFLSYSMTQLKSISNTVDNHMKDMRYVIATLDNSYTAKSYMTMSDPDALLTGTIRTLTEQLSAYKNVFPFLDSVQIYSPARNTVLSHHGEDNATAVADTHWLRYVENITDDNIHLFYRKKYDIYPYLTTLLKTINTTSGNAVICVDVNFAQMDPLSTYSGQSTDTIFIVSDDGQILYRYGQRDFLESAAIIPELSNFDSKRQELQLFQSTKAPYIYSQYHSEDYPWSYVMITEITDYTAQLSNHSNYLSTVMIFAFVIVIFLVFLVTFRSTKPISAIVHLLESPEDFSYADISSKENHEIMQKIMTYIQTSSSLSKELDVQLKQLNDARVLALQSQINPHFLMNTLNTIRALEIEELGYDHKVPEMTLILSRLLQYALDSTDCVSVSTEMHYAQLFTQLLNLRYQNTIRFDFQLEDHAKYILIPKLVIQPLAENSVFHGLSFVSDQREKFISISVRVEEEVCILTVADNGMGMEQQKLKALTESISDFKRQASANSIGLHNVILRMHLLYGDAFSWQITSIENDGTSIVLRFPTTLS